MLTTKAQTLLLEVVVAYTKDQLRELLIRGNKDLAQDGIAREHIWDGLWQVALADFEIVELFDAVGVSARTLQSRRLLKAAFKLYESNYRSIAQKTEATFRRKAKQRATSRRRPRPGRPRARRRRGDARQP